MNVHPRFFGITPLVTNKRCPKCGTLKSAKAFNKCRSSFDHLNRICRQCQHEYYLKNQEQFRKKAIEKYYAQYQETQKISKQKWYSNIENKQHQIESVVAWRRENPTALQKINKTYYLNHSEEIKSKSRKRYRDSKK